VRANAPQVREGLVLAFVNGKAVVDLDFQHLVMLLKQRPLTICFSPGPINTLVAARFADIRDKFLDEVNERVSYTNVTAWVAANVALVKALANGDDEAIATNYVGCLQWEKAVRKYGDDNKITPRSILAYWLKLLPVRAFFSRICSAPHALQCR
jgi:hypothetical protein